MNGLLQGIVYFIPLQEQDLILLVEETFLSVPGPVSKDAPSTMVRFEALATFSDEKGVLCGGVCSYKFQFTPRFCRYKYGLNLTGEEVMDMVRQKEALERAKKARESLKKSTQGQKQLTFYETKQRRCMQLELDAIHYRLCLYGEPFKLPR